MDAAIIVAVSFARKYTNYFSIIVHFSRKRCEKRAKVHRFAIFFVPLRSELLFVCTA